MKGKIAQIVASRNIMGKPLQQVVQQQQKPGAYVQGQINQQYPGQFAKLSLDQVQQFNRVDAFKAKGFTIPVGAGTITTVDLSISGLAWFLKGIQAHAITNFANDALMPTSITLIINEEKVLIDLPWTCVDIKYMTDWFFPYERYLSGNDQVLLEINNTAGGAQNVAFVCIYN